MGFLLDTPGRHQVAEAYSRSGRSVQVMEVADGETTLPRAQAISYRAPPRLAAPHDPLRGMRQRQGQARRVPAWRPGRRHESHPAPVLRSEEVADRPLRPARV